MRVCGARVAMPAARTCRPVLAASLRSACRRMSPRAPHICFRAGCHGLRGLARCGALNSERAAQAALQLYQYIDVPLDCRAARRWYVPADGDALRSAVSAALHPRRQLPKLITAPLVRQERFAPLTRVLLCYECNKASGSASRSALIVFAAPEAFSPCVAPYSSLRGKHINC